jgi:DNA polymerase-1
MAMNMPLQGTQADIIKIAMIRLEKKIREKQLPARIVLQVHDELVLEIDSRHRDDIAQVLTSTMENAFALDVPIVVEAKAGHNWEDMASID